MRYYGRSAFVISGRFHRRTLTHAHKYKHCREPTSVKILSCQYIPSIRDYELARISNSAHKNIEPLGKLTPLLFISSLAHVYLLPNAKCLNAYL